ncbi:MAG: hypothetical protein ISQ87_04430 [Rhodobacteraceae bacterium]|nr:hypothetical protein [Paracoccaceae bacterium]MBL6640497.1 hypothetical protein [Paracoccaceae bacterium]MBL6675987.1 hypothetical protein [Paracoccaceae bacterium]MBL6788429.1 hypothetical protein [Paracoccaceae bacterium]MBL6859206.1 hypothetical protein [Paracoccaceae bacterium]
MKWVIAIIGTLLIIGGMLSILLGFSSQEDKIVGYGFTVAVAGVLFLAVVRILDLLEQMLSELKTSRQILQFANPKAERLLEEEP